MSESSMLGRIEDKKGEAFELGLCNLDDARCLTDMYDLFEPKKASQGLPPENTKTRQEWVRGLLERGENFLARHGDEVVGHAALIPDFVSQDAEFLIFVKQHYRSRGLGSGLTRAALERARDLGLEMVWLTVEGHNFRAIGLYRKFGFVFCEDQGWDRMMLIRL
ncbi:MAG: GNAT family N-acetyltransferase [Proteobacteria bacterium]|nr:GNAT family N-acetyltransferase [Pseudomonadota bacterium]